ncbi:phage tail fiber protein, partial [Enterobacter hormaechei]
RVLYDDKNTVVDSNGFIKQASPVVKIFTDGKYETNDESERVTVTRLDVGQYLIAVSYTKIRAHETQQLNL